MPQVLVLEYYQHARRMICLHLKPIPGLEVACETGSAKEAVTHINSRGSKIDSALLNPDSLPVGEDVYQVISALRGQHGSDVKIVAMCSEHELENRDGMGKIHFLPGIPTPEEWRAAVV